MSNFNKIATLELTIAAQELWIERLVGEKERLERDAERYRAFRKAGLPNGLGVYDAELDAACDDLAEDQRGEA